LIYDAQKYGARVALFGRRINQAEHQRTFIQFLREIVQGSIAPDDAVRAYHGALQELGLPSRRPLRDDQQLTH
jgi:hypothetical protein